MGKECSKAKQALALEKRSNRSSRSFLGHSFFSRFETASFLGVVAKPRRSSWKKSWVTVGLSVNNWLSALTPLRPSFLSEADSIASDAEKQVRQIRDSTLARAHTRTRP